MRNILLIVFCFSLIAGIAYNADETEHEYAGLKKCKLCHRGEKNGMIFEKWESGPHAKAFETLGGEAAMEAYAKLGHEGSPQEDPACLKCHVTGYGKDSTLTEDVVMENGIACESCHGAGGDYWKKSIMEDREKSIANGMIAEPNTTCVTCHNEESPTYKEFKFEEFWEKISHSLPEEESKE